MSLHATLLVDDTVSIATEESVASIGVGCNDSTATLRSLIGATRTSSQYAITAIARCMHISTTTALGDSCRNKSHASGSSNANVTAVARRKKKDRGEATNRDTIAHATPAAATPTSVSDP
jgi:hypothetical protein